MKKNVASGTLLTLLFIGVLALAFNVQPVESDWTWTETIYIRADGSVDPDTAPISTVDNITYTLMDNIYDFIVVERDNVVVDGADHTVQGSGGGTGMRLDEVVNATVRNMEIKAFQRGIHIGDSSNVQVSGNDVLDNDFGIDIGESSNSIIVAGNNITNNMYGIHAYSLSNGTVLRNNITANSFAFGLWSSSNNSISRNDILANDWGGITLGGSSNNIISGNNVVNSYCGIELRSPSDNNLISENNITANNDWAGIWLSGSSNNIISGNSITENNWYGIYLSSSLDPFDPISSNNSIISGNTIANNTIGIDVSISCSNNIISGNNITASVLNGISIASNNVISGNNITNIGSYGICLPTVSNVTVSGNNIANSECGILAYSLSYGSISGNNITGNNSGLELRFSSDSNVSRNNIAHNVYGIWLLESTNNLVYHNSLVNNTEQIYDYSWNHPEHSSSINTWDDGYPSGGNYWSDYEERHPDAKEIDDSGIWDTPYVIDEINQDNYPLMEPWIPAPSIPTTIDELKTEAEELGSKGEIDNQGIVGSLLAKLNVAQKLVDKGNIAEAKSILEEDFIPQVQNLSDIHITPEAAELLIESAEYIISHL